MKFTTYLVVAFTVLAAVVTALAVDPVAGQVAAAVGGAVLAVVTLVDRRSRRPVEETCQR